MFNKFHNKETEYNPPDHMLSGKAFSWSLGFVIIAYIVYTAMIVLSGENSEGEPFFVYASYFSISLALILGSLCSLVSCRVKFSDVVSFKCDKKYFLIIALIFIGSYFGLSKINDYVIKFLELFGYVEKSSELPEKSFTSVALCTLFICVIPALVEEFLFRGIILSGLKDKGKGVAVIISALIFAFYHMSPQKTVYQLIMGIVLGIVAIESGSILPTVIIHFLNNFIIVMWYYFFPSFVLKGWINVVATIIGFILLALGLFLCFKKNPREIKKSKAEQIVVEKFDRYTLLEFLFASLVGIFVVTVMWIAALLS